MVEPSLGIRSYDAFLDVAIRRYRTAPDYRHATFLALLLATPEAWRIAWDESTKDGLLRPILAGAASVATLATLVRLLASGPFGVLFTGVSVATLMAVYGADPARVRRKASAIRELVDRYRGEFDDLDAERAARTMRDSKWEVMMDGLLGRFLSELHDAPEAMHDPASIDGFAEHVPSISIRPPRR